MKVLYSWGKGKTGNTCHNIDKKYPSPPSVLISLNLDQLSMGPNHSAAIVNNECLMWGEVMGRKHTTLFKIVWKRRVVSVSCGFNHTLLLTSEYKIFSMGFNQVGQLGIENVVDSAVPLPVDTLQKFNIIKIKAGNNISAAITDKGDLYIWGTASFGQLGNGKMNPKSNQFIPTTILNPLIPDHEKENPIYQNLQYSNVCFGAQHTIAVSTTGAIFSWGSNQYGQLGLGHCNTKLVPVPIHFNKHSTRIVVDIASGNFHSSLLTLEGDVYLWGSNQYGQLGQGDTIDLNLPKKVKGALEYKKINRMALGNNHTILLTKDQDVYTFGNNEFYQLGHGSMGGKNKIYFPTLIQKPKLLVSDIFAAGDSSAYFVIDESPDPSLLNHSSLNLQKSVTNHQNIVKNAHLKIFVGTWNCNAKRTQNLASWILSNSFSPDIIAIGLQEIVNMKAGAIVKATAADKQNNKENAYHPWKHDIEQTLATIGSSRYVKVMSKVLVGLMMLVYIKEEHYPYVSEVSGAIVPCGMMGKIGNKGGLGIRFTLYKTGICFVNSHLAAGPSHEKMERRTQDYKKIQMMTFENHLSILDHESLIWFGDLNYRIDLTYNETKQLVEQKNWAKLQAHDQLNNERKSGKAFLGFNEEPTNFAPTYKYDIGTTTYDTSEKNRTPSWCDRILYRGDSLKQIDYSRHELFESDHRPVSGLFLLEMKENINGWSKITREYPTRSDSPDIFSKIAIGTAAAHNQFSPIFDIKSSNGSINSSISSSLDSNSISAASTASVSSSIPNIQNSSDSIIIKRNLPAPPIPPKSKNIKLHQQIQQHQIQQTLQRQNSNSNFVVGSLPTFSPHFMFSNSPTSSDSSLDLNNSPTIKSINNNNNSKGNNNVAQINRKLSFSAEDIHTSHAKVLSNHRKIKMSLASANINNSNSNSSNNNNNNNNSGIVNNDSKPDIKEKRKISFITKEDDVADSAISDNENETTFSLEKCETERNFTNEEDDIIIKPFVKTVSDGKRKTILLLKSDDTIDTALDEDLVLSKVIKVEDHEMTEDEDFVDSESDDDLYYGGEVCSSMPCLKIGYSNNSEDLDFSNDNNCNSNNSIRNSINKNNEDDNNDNSNNSEKQSSGIISNIEELKKVIKDIKGTKGDSSSSYSSFDSDPVPHHTDDVAANGVFFIDSISMESLVIDQYSRKSTMNNSLTNSTTTTIPITTKIQENSETSTPNKFINGIKGSPVSPSSPRVLFNPIFDKSYFELNHKSIMTDIILGKQRSSPTITSPIILPLLKEEELNNLNSTNISFSDKINEIILNQNNNIDNITNHDSTLNQSERITISVQELNVKEDSEPSNNDLNNNINNENDNNINNNNDNSNNNNTNISNIIENNKIYS